jgi:CDP-paratose synthetase
MNILVTGHNGFIGRSLVKSLSEGKNQVFALKIKNRKNTIPEFVSTIIFDENNIEEFVEQLKENNIDGIIHLASKFVVKNKITQVAGLIDSNLCFGTIVLDAAKNAKVKWFVNTGTFWQHYNNKEYSPVNLYSAIKQGFQTIAQFYVETGAILFVTLILFDTYGPEDKRPKLLNLWDRISQSGEILKMSAGEQIMKINYIDDAANAFVMLAEILQNNPESVENGQIFSLNSNENLTLKQLSALFEKTLGRKLNIEWGTNPYRDREIMNPLVIGKQIPGWIPRVPINEGLIKSFKN